MEKSSGTKTTNEAGFQISNEALEAAAAYFGIQAVLDASGGRRWSVGFATDVTSAQRQQQQLLFDDSARRWRLNPHGTLNSPRKRVKTDPYYGTSLFPHYEVPYASRTPSNGAVVSTRVTPDSPPDTESRRGEDECWTRLLPVTEHADFLRHVDWASTSIGPMASWPQSLRLYTHMMLSDSRAAAVYWGKDRIAIYNEHFVPLIGSKHPSFMGMPFQVTWPEIWDSFDLTFRSIETTGLGMNLDDYNLVLERNGYTEETWWAGDLLPLRGDDGRVGGFYFVWTEVTRQYLSDRRTKIVNEIGAHQPSVAEPFWQHVLNVFKSNPRDITMAILYSADEEPSRERCTLKLQGTIGIPAGHPYPRPLVDLFQDNAGFIPVLRKARKAEADWIVIDRETGTLTDAMVSGIDWQGFEEPSTMVAILPLFVINQELKGFVTIGLNPRRALDNDHRQFISEMSRQLCTLLTSLTTADQARRREAQLTKDLADSERRVRRMAELAPVGMYDIGPDGSVLWANSHFYEILGHSTKPEDQFSFSFKASIHPDDQTAAISDFGTLFIGKQDITRTLRLSRKWLPPASLHHSDQPVEESAWILNMAYPNIENGNVTSIMGCFTDISEIQWASAVQKRTAEVALKARQLQEEFIDITSHEMRNPMSAVTQCADSIVGCLKEYRASAGDADAVIEILKANIDAAETILLCTSHQRRIIDDVLTLSKLDSSMLTISPTVVRPRRIVEDAVHMFDTEFVSNGIDAEIVEDSLVSGNKSELVYCDPSRVMQIFINLLTNAIKFTRTEDTRKLLIRYGESAVPPSASTFGETFRYSPTNKPRRDLTTESDYGDGTIVYLFFAVQDTGRGLKDEETANLFNKFIQASRRTHIKYGGSGLGLFISRELTEMQGGLIGVGSKEGVGSTFAFYIKARSAPMWELNRKPSVDLVMMPVGLRRSRNASLTSTAEERVSGGIPGGGLVAPSVPIPLPLPRVSSETSTQHGAVTATVPPYEILLVEDNLVNQKVLGKQLRKVGCVVHVANHGQEALDFLKRTRLWVGVGDGIPSVAPIIPSSARVGRLDCILMDIEMPVLDGLAATREIRRLEDEGWLNGKEGGMQGRVVVIAITANARGEQIKSALESGVDDVVTKPFRVKELMGRIGDLVSERKKVGGTGR